MVRSARKRNRILSRRFGAMLLVGLALVLIAANGGGRCSPDGVYVMSADAAFLEGCIDGPCLCAVAIAPLRGYFRLVLLPTAAPFDVYEMRDVHWWVVQGENVRSISGTGSYSVAGGQHSVQMELVVSEDAAESYTSGGFVRGGGGFPEEIAIRMSTGPFCYGRVIELHARAFPAL